MRKIYFLLVMMLASVGVWGQTPNGFLDFGNPANGTTATTGNTGFGGVRVGTGGGGFTLQNPGQSIGTNAELRGIAPSTGSVNSVGLTSAEYGTAAATFTISFELHLSGGSSGTWYFFAGNGTSYGSTQTSAFTGSETFTGIRWVFGASNAITTDNRAAGTWATVSGTPFAQNNSYFVTIVGNNTASTVNYGASQTVAANTYDLWINGVLAGNDLGKAQLATSTNINAFRFYGENSTGNVATIALDNIRWYNSAVLPPTHLVFSGVPATGTTGTNLASFKAEAHSGSATGPIATAFTGNMTLAKATGSGNISGTLVKAAVSGESTFDDIQFDAADTYTMDVTAAAPIIKATSGNVVISLASSPLITLTPTSLSGFTYVAGAGPSGVQSFSVSGINLTGAPGNITVTAPTNYEINDGNGWVSTFDIPYATSTLGSTNVDVRLKAGLAVGTYNGEIITVAGGGDSKNETLSGSVTLGTPVANAPTIFTATSFTADWAPGVAGATAGYFLDASASSTFSTAGTLVSDGFENSLSLFTETSGTGNFFTGNTAVGENPASSPYAIAGTYSYGKSGGSVTITSSDINTSASSGTQLSFRLASFSVNTSGNGADVGDIVTVEISPDGGTTYYSTLRVLGNTNAVWAYTASGIASTAYDGDGSPVNFQPVGGGVRTTDGYSTVTITGLPSTSNLRIRITLLNDNANERWVVDDLAVTGTIGSFLTGYNNLAVAGTSQAVTVPGPGTYYYRVRATTGSVTSANSNVVSVIMNDQNTAAFRSTGTGDYSNNGSWEFNVSPPSYFAGATQVPTINNDVTIQNGHTITLTGAAAANSLSLGATGNIILGTNNLVVNNTTGGSTTGYIRTNGTGTLTVNNITTGKTLPVGNSTYNPLLIENGSGYNWSARVIDGLTADPGYNTDRAVLRQWDITPSVNPPATGADITFQFNQNTPHVGALFSTATSVQAWHNPLDAGWVASGSPTGVVVVDPTTATVKVTGLTGFSKYALSNVDGPLPVSLLSFSGYKDGSRNQLSWTTASELNNRGFDVQRSTDGVNYTSIGFVNSLASGGNSNDRLSYRFTDNTVSGIKQYYRLRQEDLDGRSKLSNIVLIRNERATDVMIDGLFPNPANNVVNVLVAAPARTKLTVLVTDMTGRMVMQQISNVETGSNTIQLNVAGLTNGTYLVHLVCENGCKPAPAKFVKH